MNKAFQYFLHALRSAIPMLGYNYPFDHQWNAMLEQILGSGQLISSDDCTALFVFEHQEWEVWVGNPWFAYAYLRRKNGEYLDRHLRARPRFKTMLQLHEVVQGSAPPKQSRKDFYNQVIRK